jgi:hypothetical protein
LRNNELFFIEKKERIQCFEPKKQELEVKPKKKNKVIMWEWWCINKDTLIIIVFINLEKKGLKIQQYIETLIAYQISYTAVYWLHIILYSIKNTPILI